METHESRQERREKKLRKQRERMMKHGRGMAQLYRDAVTKRLQQGTKPGGDRPKQG